MNAPNKAKRTKVQCVRWSDEQWQQVIKKAQEVKKTPSELVRLCTLGNRLVSIADVEAAKELRQIGRMMKGLYPKDANWSKADQVRYWACINKLFAAAGNLDGKSAKKGQSKVAPVKSLSKVLKDAS